MNKVILSLFVLAGVLCLTNAACTMASFQKCASDARSAIAAGAGDKTKLCAAIKMFTDCVTKSGCANDATVKAIIDAINKSLGSVTCGSAVSKVSIVAVMIALVASYFSK